MGAEPAGPVGLATVQTFPPAVSVPCPSAQLKSTVIGIEPAMAMVPDAIAHPIAEKANFLTQVAFIPNLLPKMENQSFEKLLYAGSALAFRLVPCIYISLDACDARMRKSLGTA
jgi:hypothetical protein